MPLPVIRSPEDFRKLQEDELRRPKAKGGCFQAPIVARIPVDTNQEEISSIRSREGCARLIERSHSIMKGYKDVGPNPIHYFGSTSAYMEGEIGFDPDSGSTESATTAGRL